MPTVISAVVMSEVTCSETITRSAEAQGVHSKIFDNGNGEFAAVKLKLERLAGANTVIFSSAVRFGLSQEYQLGIEDGIDDAVHNGVLNSGRVIDVRVTLLDAKHQEIDSNRTFRLATIAAFQEAMRNAGPVLVNRDRN